MGKRLFSATFIALLLLITPFTTALADGEENGAAGSLMEGPFVILAIATLVIMIYYCFRD